MSEKDSYFLPNLSFDPKIVPSYLVTLHRTINHMDQARSELDMSPGHQIDLVRKRAWLQDRARDVHKL